MIVIYRPWINRVAVLLVAVLTLGLLWIDHPRIRRLPKVGPLRRWWMALKARVRGTRDGRLGIPRQNDKMAPPEVWKLKQQGDGVVRGIAATWAATDARLTGEHGAIERAITSVDERVQRLTGQIKELSSRCESRRKRLLEMKTTAEQEHPEERWRIRSWFYVPALFVIFAGEFPLNALAFEIFGESKRLTYAITVGLAAVLVFCAHSLGILWRQRAMSDRDMFVTALLFVLPIAAIGAIAFTREEFVRQGGGLAVLSPTAGIIIFVVMNLVIYLAAFALSYLHHDPAGELIERVAREVRRADRQIRRRRRQLERAAGLKKWLQTKLALWEGAQDEAHRHAAFQAKRHKDFFEAAMQEYWGANRRVTEHIFKRDAARARRRGETQPEAAEAWTPPKSLENPPEIAQDLWTNAFNEDLMQRLFAARDGGSGGKRPAKRARKKATSTNGSAHESGSSAVAEPRPETPPTP